MSLLDRAMSIQPSDLWLSMRLRKGSQGSLIMRNHVLDARICGAAGHLTATLVGTTWPPRLLCGISTSIFVLPSQNRYLVGGLRTRFVSCFISIVVSFSTSCVFPRQRYLRCCCLTSLCVSVVFLVSRSDGDSRFHGEDAAQYRAASQLHPSISTNCIYWSERSV